MLYRLKYKVRIRTTIYIDITYVLELRETALFGTATDKYWVHENTEVYLYV